jgi:hypothetical protein
MILKLKIDVTKIDKSRLFTGSKGTYLDATVLIKDAPDQYGNDGMIVQDVTKEERESGQRGEILGNAKWMGTDRPSGAPAPVSNDPGAAYHAAAAAINGSEDIPF